MEGGNNKSTIASAFILRIIDDKSLRSALIYRKHR